MSKKIYISYSTHDRSVKDKIVEVLKENGHTVFTERASLRAGSNFLNEISKRIVEADIILVICSKSSMSSTWVHRELESLVFNTISDDRKKIIPIRVDGTPLPGYLLNRRIYNVDSKNVRVSLSELLSHLSAPKVERKSSAKKRQDELEEIDARNSEQIQKIRSALKSGRLTIVCGAGVSVGANVPSWNNLLLDLLDAMMRKVSKSQSVSFSKINAEDFQKKLGTSSLVIGKYLQSNLGIDFLDELRNSLYDKNPKSCELIDAIVEVARPQRDGKPLDSIITFNFDALLEENLEKNNIKYRAIYAEGIRSNSDELPIYHVHGYLPRNGKLSKDFNVVLSEDAYHTQFIEPFSWANLIQLNKLSQNSCLLLGISLTDPNMRRLLDVAKRKDPSLNLNHYIVKKIPRTIEKSEKKDEMLMFLEEQDANDLGLNVLWVNEFDQIPNMIRKLIA